MLKVLQFAISNMPTVGKMYHACSSMFGHVRDPRVHQGYEARWCEEGCGTFCLSSTAEHAAHKLSRSRICPRSRISRPWKSWECLGEYYNPSCHIAITFSLSVGSSMFLGWWKVLPTCWRKFRLPQRSEVLQWQNLAGIEIVSACLEIQQCDSWPKMHPVTSGRNVWGYGPPFATCGHESAWQPSFACACERNWRTCSFIHRPIRDKLDPPRTVKLVCVLSNLRILRAATTANCAEQFQIWPVVTKSE